MMQRVTRWGGRVPRRICFVVVLGVAAGVPVVVHAQAPVGDDDAVAPTEAEAESEAAGSEELRPDIESDEGEASMEGEEAAREHFQAGRAAYVRGAFEEALRHFEAAYRKASPLRRVFMLVNIAQALDRLDREEEALRHYERYLALAPEGPLAPLARGRVRVLRERLRARREAAQREAARVERLRAEREAERARAERLNRVLREREKGAHWWPWAVAGGTALVAGAVLAVVMLSGDGEAGSIIDPPPAFEEVLLVGP